MAKTMLMITSVASMIKQFNMNNITILQKLGYQVHVGTNFEHGSSMSRQENQRLKQELHDLGVKFFQIDFPRGVGNPRTVLRAIRQLSQIVRQQHFRFIHCQSPMGGVCGRIVGHRYKIPVLYTAHGFHFFHGSPVSNWLMIYPVEKYLSRFTDTLITINHEDNELAKAKFDAKKVDYLPGIGIDVKAIAATKVNLKAKRADLGIPADATVILSVGELNTNKNHKVVLQALREIHKQNIYYVICGIGNKAQELKDLAKASGLEDRFKLLGYRTDVWQIMKMADLFVFPSFREGLPVSLMEAMAAGLPIIASNTRGNVDLIKNGTDGFLFNPQDVRTLVADINQLLTNKTLQVTFKKAELKKVSLFDQSVVNRQMYNIYRSF